MAKRGQRYDILHCSTVFPGNKRKPEDIFYVVDKWNGKSGKEGFTSYELAKKHLDKLRKKK